MMLVSTEVRLDDLVDPVAQHLLPLLEDALTACAERHRISDGQGADNFSFGTDAWSLPARLFRDAINDGEIPFALAPEPGCVLRFGSVKIRHHCVGFSEKNDIASSFPRNAKALGEQVERARNQMSFDFPDAMSPEDVGGIVLAYMANPGAGLCAVYLARVGQVQAGKIVGWAETREVYRRDNPNHPPPTSGQTSVPVEEMPAPVVRRVPKQKPNVG